VCTDDRLVIELVAKAPDIVTPTGISVDEQGRVWVIENHTHQRPPTYNGPPSDRIRIFSDFDKEGKATKITTYAEGFKNSMGLAHGKNGVVYFATRSEVYTLRDTRGAGVADEKKVIVKLESKGDYPHNGLSGFAFDGLDNLYFALGENLGESYKLVGSDGSSESGGGEGGSIYRCRPDGSKLTRVATGFWNTFHLTFDAFGRLFAVDNDPDSRGPCRLLHIVQGGDYGYRFRNGRKGLHPFTAWNGELPGTLPMVAGTAEAPSGILAYESNGLPEEYRGSLLVTSWGDHVIDRFTLFPRGASFGAKQQTLVRGSEDFRPVAIVQGPDGAVYVSDWVDKSYPVHGKGAIWRIRMKNPPKDDGLRASKVKSLEVDKLKRLMTDPRREIRQAAVEVLIDKSDPASKENNFSEALPGVKWDLSDRVALEVLWARAREQRRLFPRDSDAATKSLGEVLASCTHFWPAEERKNSSAVRAEAVRLYGILTEDEKPVLALLKDERDPHVRREAMALLRKKDSITSLVPMLADNDPFIAGTALDRLGSRGNTEFLRKYAFDKDAKLRLGVLLALRRAGEAEGREMLRAFLADADPEVRRAAIQWVGEERLKDYAEQLKVSAAKLPVTRELFEAYLASTDLLAGAKPNAIDEVGGERLIVPILQDAKQPAEIHAIALRMIRPDHAGVTLNLLEPLLADVKNPELRREAVRTLALRSDAASQKLLRSFAGKGVSAELHNEALAGLALSAESPETKRLLFEALNKIAQRRDALRSLREAAAEAKVEQEILAWWEKINQGPAPAERREVAGQVLLALRGSKSADIEKHRKALAAIAEKAPANEAEWKTLASQKGDSEAGRRLFFHKNGPRCFACHQVDGRGAKIGPDLSKIGRSAPRDKIIESILTPSKEIAPMFVAWRITTSDGKVHEGLIVEEGSIGGVPSSIKLADATGKITVIKRSDIEERHALATSIMPDKLVELMTPGEFVDLIAFLTSLK
jgi:putative membrane-bound dehydrogenase-like protein